MKIWLISHSKTELVIDLKLFLVIGLGSMGKRRIRNLQKLGYKNIIGFDTRTDRCDETARRYKIRTFTSFNSAIHENPSIFIISTPPHLHDEYIRYAFIHNIPFFCELNLLSEVTKKFVKKENQKSIISSASSTMRFHPLVKELKKLLDKNTIGKVYFVEHRVGHYLPNWHPWESYHDFFVSRKETGGAKELVPVELNWLTYLFSSVVSVFSNVSKISDLDADIDDNYQSVIEFEGGISCMFSVDVFSKPSFKETKIIGKKGSILADFQHGVISVYSGKRWKKIKVKYSDIAAGYAKLTPPEALYVEELDSFLKALHGNKTRLFTLNDELKILKILDCMEKSNKLNKSIKLENSL